MMNQSESLFTNRDLKNLVLPLFMEQLLTMLVGIADIFIVSFVGEAAVSGVSLVNSFNTIFIYLFTALASGGAVVISQYIGRNEPKIAGEASSQLFTSSVLFSIVTAVLILLINRPLMRMMFGQVEQDVMAACVTYLRISAYSYPALAIYNAGAALYRSFGKTSTTMYISLIANTINIAGNLIGVFVLKAGVAGVAYPSFISRTFSAIAITILCFGGKNPVQYHVKWILSWKKKLQYQMLRIAIPNGVESGVFQLVKVALSSVVALFGTYQIAANGIAQSIWGMAALVCVTMGPVFITVIGQCMGAGDTQAADYYFRKLLKITLLFSLVWNGLIFAVTPILMHFYSLAEETKHLVIVLVLIHNICNAVAFPFADPFGKGLRATGDVKFTTAISLFTTVGVRLVFSVLFGITLNLGVVGIAYAMCLDWIIRGIIFWIRFKKNKWKQCKVI
ncbi:MATE family efflux transporter [Blautia pseudococcoides]|nr:MATE family efflux transporter [Blautia pseudococcoides]